MTAVLDAISGCMSPIIPAIIGAGIVKVLLIVLGYFVPADNQTTQLLDVIGDAAFDFLPVLVAFSAGRKFGANPMLTASVVAVLIICSELYALSHLISLLHCGAVLNLSGFVHAVSDDNSLFDCALYAVLSLIHISEPTRR